MGSIKQGVVSVAEVPGFHISIGSTGSIPILISLLPSYELKYAGQ